MSRLGLGLSFQVLSSPADWNAHDVRSAWDRMHSSSDPIGAVYRSPAWFNHMNVVSPAMPRHVAVVRDQAGAIHGVAGLGVRRVSLPLRAGGLNWLSIRPRIVDLFGGQPLLDDDADCYDCLFSGLDKHFPDCDGIRLADIPIGGSLFQYLHESAAIQHRFLVCDLGGMAPYHTLPLPTSYAQYQARFTRKKRYNLRRQERLLRDHGSGRLELRRWERPQDVANLLRQLALLTDRGKSNRAYSREDAEGLYGDLACRGLLRCYTLVCGEQPVAAWTGCQYGDVYAVDNTLFDKSLARLSPGATMSHLAAADLVDHRPVRLIDFGYGMPRNEHAHRIAQNYAKVVLLRKTWTNCVRWASLRMLMKPIRLVENQIRRLTVDLKSRLN
jgi:hypothetical protein